jgi:hypothetical protein
MPPSSSTPYRAYLTTRMTLRLKAPIFVLGLPRTGTTFLHHLLSLDPDVQYPRTFELLDPVGCDRKGEPAALCSVSMRVVSDRTPQLCAFPCVLLTKTLVPARAGSGKPMARAKRVAYTQSKLALVKKFVPQVEVMHEIGAEEPEARLLAPRQWEAAHPYQRVTTHDTEPEARLLAPRQWVS